MKKTYKILGNRGRITIPFELRMRMGFAYNDVISFEEKDSNTIIIQKEKICDNCSKEQHKAEKATDEITLLDFLDGLPPAEQRAVLVHLSCKWAELQRGDMNAR